jgi:hypothetical protein
VPARLGNLKLHETAGIGRDKAIRECKNQGDVVFQIKVRYRVRYVGEDGGIERIAGVICIRMWAPFWTERLAESSCDGEGHHMTLPAKW